MAIDFDASIAPSAPPAPQDQENVIQLSTISECTAVSAAETKEMLILAHLKAPVDNTKQEAERPPLSVTSVIDRSGSMEGGKLDLVKISMKFVIEQMRAVDEFGIVSYDDKVKEELCLTKMDSEGKRRALDAVDRIRTGGSTNLSGGLFAGLEQQGCPVMAVPETDRLRNRRPLGRGGYASGPATGVQRQTLELVVGNTHTAVPAQGDKTSHDWTAYVRAQDASVQLDQYVEKVRFDLHPTFNPPTVEISAAPFQVRRIGWGYFDIQVTVCLKAEYGGTEHKITLALNFEKDDSNKTFVVALNHQTPAAPAVTFPTPLPVPAPRSTNAVPSVWLFTDGLANQGIQNADVLRTETLKRMELLPKCTLFTFGFGADHNAAMLKDLAAAGSGVYYYVEQENQISESFADCFGGLTSVVAQNLRLQLQLQSGTKLLQLITTYQHTVSDNSAAITLRDMYAEEERDVVVHIQVPATAQTESQLIAGWTLEYVNTTANGKVERCSAELRIARPETAERQEPPRLLDQQRNRIRCTEAMKLAQSLGDAQRLEEARKVLDGAIAEIQQSLTGSDPICQFFLKDLQEAKEGLRDRHEYEAKGKKHMAWKESEHCQQRSANSACWSNVAKSSMKAKMSK